MKLLSVSTTTLALLLCAWAPALHAQTTRLSNLKYPSGDDLIATAPGSQQAPHISRGATSSLAVWSDERSDLLHSPVANQTTYDIYAARLDDSGALLDTTPFIVSQSFGYQREPLVEWNGSSWLVVWEDESPTMFSPHTTVFGMRVAADGTLLDPQPFSITDLGTFSSAFLEDLTSNGSDWLILAQADTGGGVKGFRVAADGSVLNPLGSSVAPNTFFLYFNIEAASAGGEYLVSYKASSQYLAQRFAADLTPIGSTFTVPPLLDIGSRGSEYFAIWSAANSTLRGSAMSVAGTLSFPDGVTISSPASLVSPGDEFVTWDGTNWWTTWRKAGQGIAVARITPSHTVLDPGGFIPLPGISATVQRHNAAPLASGGIQLVWDDDRSGSLAPYDVLSASVSDTLVTGAEVALSTGAPSQLGPDLAAGSNGYLMAFRSDTADSSRILVQRLDGFGNPVGAPPLELASGSNSGIGFPSVAWNGSLYLVAWPDNSVILGRRVAADGTPIDATPFTIQPGFAADVAALNGNFLVLASNRLTFQIIMPFTMRVDGATGALLDPTPLNLGGVWSLNPSLTTFDGRWLGTWQNHFSHDNPQAEIIAAFIDADGTSPGKFVVGDVLNTGGSPDVAASGDTALFLWRSLSLANADNNLAARAMAVDGTMTEPVLISTAAGRQLEPSVVWTGDEFLAAWQDQRNQQSFYDNRTEFYGARFDSAGALLDPNGFPMIVTGKPARDSELASFQGRSLLAGAFFDDNGGVLSYRVATATVGAWRGLNGSLSGLTTPVLDAEGDLSLGSNVQFGICHATPMTFGVYFFGATRVDLPFLGGIQVPEATLLQVFKTGPFGTPKLNLTLFNPVPPGTELFVQAWIFDSGAPESWAATNAIETSAP